MSHSQLCTLPSAMDVTGGNNASCYMSTHYPALSEKLTVHEAQQLLLEQLTAESFSGQVLILAGDKLCGVLSVRHLLQEQDAEKSITQLMFAPTLQVKPEDSRADICRLIDNDHPPLIPVIDNGRVVGCLKEKEIARLLADDATEDAQRQGATQPLEKAYLDISPLTLWRKRSVWLMFLFIAQAYTSSVIQHFEEALESVIALAFFIPLLIGTGGNSGTQITSTLVRAMALGEVRLRDLGKIVRKELTTALLIALTLGCAGLVRAWMMGIGAEITVIVGLTLVCITLWSAVISSVTPMVLKRLGIDPAVVSAPFISTLIDGTGLIIYFKIAEYVLSANG